MKPTTTQPRPYRWTTKPRLRGRPLHHARARLLAAQPCCAHCKRILMPDRFIRDHVVPLAEGGLDIESNTQALCPDCHTAKTQAEAARGQARNR